MSVVLYARVSTPEQGEKELSIPAQLRTLRRLCTERRWVVAGVFTDVASGTSLNARPGLLSAIHLACKSREVDTFFVHRIDRFARSLFTHLTLKGKLKQHGVQLVSAVEHCEDSPVGHFIESIMAAQAEFHSANMAQQIKGGIEERLRTGRWHTTPPLGYLKVNGEVVLDPARSQFIRLAFERFVTGTIPTPALADELHRAGLVSRTGKKVMASKICEILHNPFYMGTMVVSGKTYDGIHPRLVSEELFNRCQLVFKRRTGGQPRQHHHFLLSRKLVCPNCMGFLGGDQHTKKSGKVFRYYRCVRKGCSFLIRAGELEELVRTNLQEHLRRDRAKVKLLMGDDPVEAKAIFDQAVLRVELRRDLSPRLVFTGEDGSKSR